MVGTDSLVVCARRALFRFGAVAGELVIAALGDLDRPIRIGQQGSADRDEVELLAFQSPQERIDRGRGRWFAGAQRADEFAGESHRADRDRCGAGEFLGPAREVEVRAFELRLPEAPLRAVERIDPGFGQRLEPAAHLLGRPGIFRVVGVEPELREAQDQRNIGAELRAACAHDLDAEARALVQRSIRPSRRCDDSSRPERIDRSSSRAHRAVRPHRTRAGAPLLRLQHRRQSRRRCRLRSSPRRLIRRARWSPTGSRRAPVVRSPYGDGCATNRRARVAVQSYRRRRGLPRPRAATPVEPRRGTTGRLDRCVRPAGRSRCPR